MTDPGYFAKYMDYITNTGGNPSVEAFDEDWEPIGPILRRDMGRAKLIKEVDGKIQLVDT